MGGDIAYKQYAEACKRVAGDYIERSTRFGSQDLRFAAVTTQFLQLTIKVRHTLEVISEFEDYQGSVRPSGSDFSTSDWALYQKQVEHQATAEFKRPETREELAEAIKSSRYAAISSRQRVRTHPRRLFHPYLCGTCHGSGDITCHGCGGRGNVTCGGCSGAGDKICYSCGGSGRQAYTESVRDMTGHYRTETRYRSCGTCLGGRVRCSGCGGSGQVRCGTCRGSGQLVCSICAGHGSMTRVTATHTYTTPSFFGIYPDGKPSYLHEALCKLGFAKLHEHGEVIFDRVESVSGEAAIDFYYNCTMPVCDLAVEVAGHTSLWAMIGNHPQIHDAGGILEVLLSGDQKDLVQLGGAGTRWLPWFHRLARPVLKNVMESEVHQNVVTHQINGLSVPIIVERVNRSVSEMYVQKLLISLHSTNQAVSRWVAIKFWLFLLLVAPAVLLGTMAVVQRDMSYTIFENQNRFDVFSTRGWIGYTVIAVILAVFTMLAAILNRWWHRRWLNGIGGRVLVAWAEKNGLLVGKWSTILAIVVTTTTTGKMFERFPAWVDRDGKLYGVIKFHRPPQSIPLVIPANDLAPNKPVLSRKKKTRKGMLIAQSYSDIAEQ